VLIALVVVVWTDNKYVNGGEHPKHPTPTPHQQEEGDSTLCIDMEK